MSSLRRSADNARRRHREHKSSTAPASAYDLPDLTGSASSSGSSSSNHSQQRYQQQPTALPKRRQHRRNRHIPSGGRLGHHHQTPLGIGGGRGTGQRKKNPRNLKQRTSHPAVMSSTAPHTSSSLAAAARSKRRTMRRKSSSPKSRSSNADNSILRGAQILREQLLHDEDEMCVPPTSGEEGGRGLNISLDEEYDYQEALNVRLGTNASNRMLDNRDDQYYENDGEESFSGSDGEWSNPWVVSNSKSPTNNSGRHHEIDEVLGDDLLVDEKSAFSFPTKGDASDWAELSSVDEKPNPVAPPKLKPGEDDQGYDTLLDSQDDQGYDTLLDSSVEFHTRTEPPLLTSEADQRHAQPSDDDTPETFMGRDRALKTKMVTYWVQRADELEGDSTTLNSSLLADPQRMKKQDELPLSYLPNDLKREASPKSRKHTRDDDTGFMLGMEASLLPQNKWDELKVNVHEAVRPAEREDVSAATKDLESSQYDQLPVLEAAESDRNVRAMPVPSCDVVEEDSISPLLDDSSGETKRFKQLLKDPGFQHAQKAGVLWQSLVSQHVRFPDGWFRNGSRNAHRNRRLWHYVGRHRVQDNPVLNFLVGNRGSSGRLLLHLVVRDLMTLAPVQDIAIGCFHPNARGVRWTTEFLPDVEDCRDVWMAFRRRTDECTVAEKLLKPDDGNNDGDPEMNDSASPLGGKHAVNNRNMRPVFGEKAPIHTIFVEENELYELLSSHELKGSLPPALILLQHYLRP